MVNFTACKIYVKKTVYFKMIPKYFTFFDTIAHGLSGGVVFHLLTASPWKYRTCILNASQLTNCLISLSSFLVGPLGFSTT